MTANETRVQGFLSRHNTQFVIPIYQRNYDWREEHCKQLLNDILAVGSSPTLSPHFIGSIVLVSDNASSTGRINEFVIIDGQQRLTTLTLIYLAICRVAREQNNKRLDDEITNTYLTNSYADESEKLKLRPTENNDEALKILLRGDDSSHIRGYSHIAENFNYFRSKITAENLDVVRNGLAKLMFVEISLDRQNDDPQRIFESMNSTGLDLSQADLIRNYILMGLNATEQKHLYEEFWRPIENYCHDSATNESKVAGFIRDYLTTKNKRIPNKSKVYSEFKTAWQRTDFAGWRERLSILKTSAAHYAKLLNPELESAPAIKKNLHQIKRLEITVSYPFLLRVYADYSDNNSIDCAAFANVLELIQSFVFRRQICDLPSAALNKIFTTLYDKVFKDDYLPSLQRALAFGPGQSRFPKDEETRDKLRVKDVYGMRNYNREYLLEQLENFQNRECVFIEGNDQITVEHIFPQNPDPKWKLDLDDSDYSLLKNEFLHTLGNLTLSGNNGALGNKTFVDKRDMPEKGYKDSRLWLNRHLATLAKWDVQEYEHRAAFLADRFLKIWAYPPEVALERNANVEPEMLLSDIDAVTYRSVEYAVFLGQKIVAQSFAECYAEIIRKAFELMPEKFIETELGKQLRITQNKPKNRNSAKINDSWFIDTNYSSTDKIKQLKRLCNALDFDDDISFKFKPILIDENADENAELID